jgi:lactam utilization protein B
MCAGLDAAERAELTSLLQRIAAHHGLAPGVHPGYRDLAAAK